MKKLPIISAVYCIMNTQNGKQYIGSTKNFHKRKRDHLYKLKNNIHDNIHLQRSWNKHGSQFFKFYIVERTHSLLTREQYYLDTLNPLFNIGAHASGGDNLSKHPQKQRIIDQISKSLKQKFESMTPADRERLSQKFTGTNNPNYGNTWSKRQKKKASDRAKQNPPSKESVKRLQDGNQRAWNDPLFREKMSQARTGDGNNFYGKKHKKSTKKQISRTKKEHFKNSTPEQRYHDNPQIRKVQIGTTIYFGVSEAARHLGVCPATIVFRIKSKSIKFKDYFYKD